MKAHATKAAVEQLYHLGAKAIIINSENKILILKYKRITITGIIQEGVFM